MYYQDDYFGNGEGPFDFQDILITGVMQLM